MHTQYKTTVDPGYNDIVFGDPNKMFINYIRSGYNDNPLLTA